MKSLAKAYSDDITSEAWHKEWDHYITGIYDIIIGCDSDSCRNSVREHLIISLVSDWHTKGLSTW